MSKTVRIRTTPNGDDAYLKVKVEQDFDFIEILSLKISQAEAYSRFCSDYGVVVGRVIVNNGFGIPNAKVSIFVPLTDEDEEDSEIKGLYPFKVIDDKDSEGIRYNLLQTDPNPIEKCFTPVGTFPAKREVIDNDTTLEVYDKYYKFTTTTNDAGDFMLFGVPTGSHILNVDVDLSDIGIASQRPYDYIGEGESEKKFETPTKFKGDKDLDKLIQIKSFKKGVNVQPFWGDKDQCDIGITRADIDIKKNIVPKAIFMGSLFSDSDKNSINKNCRPRKDMGRLCETETGQGSVEMIRKTLDGKIERFDVEGGRVVNEFGSWAYQIPMNLDFKITDEFGNLVPSEDPNKGIATRTSVRFRISKDVSGDEGRLRTTAKYLVPHNPVNSAGIDYNFDENTTAESFRNFHWNKIYSVSNFIPRIQANCIGSGCADNRNMTGIKDVDDCSGLKNPFPYNRVDTDFNPLFTIICLIMSIIVLIIFLINSTVIAFVNLIIYIINAILEVICKVIHSIGKTIEEIASLVSKIPFVSWSFDACPSMCIGTGCCDCENILSYVPCITLDCENQVFAPGCNCSDSNSSTAPLNGGGRDTSGVGNSNLGCWAARTQNGKNIEHWSGINPNNDHCPHDGHNTPGAGFTDCIAIKLAESLNMFEFDFYNDWINGTLYTYLLKFKKAKRDKTKFCDSECDESHSDNGCDKSHFVDTCGDGRNGRNKIKSVTEQYIDEGFIKMVTKKLPDGREEDTLYYAPYARKVSQKLFATELIHLGSVFDCDWQGIPKIQPLLTPTSYNRPPYIDEYLFDIQGNTTSTKTACGMTSTGGNGTSGVFFDIDCIGLTVGQIYGAARCDNFKRQCEFGMNIDEADLSATNTVITQANCYLNDTDLAQPYADRVRDIFYQLNINAGSSKLDSWPANANGLPAGINTGFGNGTGASTLGTQYKQFRGNGGQGAYAPTTNNFGGYTQPNNSFYFYFGTSPGQGGLDLMNRKYFTTCEPVVKNDFVISGIIDHVETAGACDGEIGVTVVGGEPAYVYNWTGPIGWSNPSTSIGDLTGLCGGVYNLTVTDANGGTSTISFTVNEPATLTCSVTATDALNNGGEGTLYINAFGGSPNYTYSINGGTAVSMAPNSSASVNMSADTYIVDVMDATGAICTNPTTGVTISEPPTLSIQTLGTFTDTTCGNDNGTISVPLSSSIGGTPPYTTQIVSLPPLLPYTSNTSAVGGLASGSYTVTTTDSGFALDSSGNTIPSPQTDSISFTIAPSIAATLTYINSWYCWEYGNTQSQNIKPAFNVTANGAFTITAQDLGNASIPIISQSFPALTTVATMSALHKDIIYDFKIVDADGCEGTTSANFGPGFGQVPATPMRLDYSNSSEKYCWTTTNPDINPRFNVWADGPFTISWNGTSSGSQSFPSGVPAGANVSISSLVSANATTFTLTETTARPAGIVCSTIAPVNFASQLPAGQLSVTISQAANICGTNNSTTLSASVVGGYGSNSLVWYKNGATYTTATSPTITDPTNCGDVWKVRVTDAQGCYKYSGDLTIL